MRIYSRLIVCVISILMVAACSNEQDLLFEKSSAERLAEAKKECTEYLCAQENGWLMEYFPNGGSAGVVFLMRFDKNGSCLIGTKNEYQTTFATERSLFEMIADNGPVLSFNTYNNLFHIYSYPALPGSSTADGKGLQGDYEFIVLKKEAECAWLKGKKYGAYIRMRPLSADQDWEAIFTGIDVMKSRLLSSDSFIPLVYHKGDSVRNAYYGNSGIFTLVKPGEDIEMGQPLPLIVLPDAFRTYTDGMYVEGSMYVPDDTNTRINCLENSESDYFTGISSAVFFVENTTLNWKADTTAFNPSVKAVLQQIRTRLSSPSFYKGQMKLASVNFSSALFEGALSRALVLRFMYGKVEYLLPIKMDLNVADGEQVVVSFQEPLDYSSNVVGSTFIKNGFDEFLLLPPLLSGTYQLSSINSFILKDLTFSSGSGNIILQR